MSARASTTRRGMTLFEVMIALVILGLVMLGMGSFVVRFVRGTRTAATVSTALDLVNDRIEAVKGAPTYTAIDTMARTEATITGYPGFTRVTMVTHTGGGSSAVVDYRAVTVTCTGPGMTTPVKKSTFIAKF